VIVIGQGPPDISILIAFAQKSNSWSGHTPEERHIGVDIDEQQVPVPHIPTEGFAPVYITSYSCKEGQVEVESGESIGVTSRGPLVLVRIGALFEFFGQYMQAPQFHTR
jgi:hypothetical protein